MRETWWTNFSSFVLPLTKSKEQILREFIASEAKRKFPAYFVAFNKKHGGSKYTRLQRYVANWIDNIVRDENGNLKGGRGALSQPPQTGKTNLTTKEYISFLLGAIPGIQIAITGHNVSLLYRFSTWIRDRVNSPLWSEVFGAEVKSGEDRMSEWAMTNGSRLMVRTVGQPLTGSHVDLLVIDDVYSGREQAESAARRQVVKDWYMANCLTRISPNGSIICVNTRWHKEDLIGYLTSEDYIEQVLDAGGTEEDLYQVVNLTALCEDPDTDPLGRELGESVFPEFKSAEWFLRIKAQIDAYEWQTQYQGDPQVRTESDIDLEKIHRIEYKDVPAHIEKLRGWDTALSEEQLADYTAGALCAYDGDTDSLYIINVFRNKASWTKNYRIITELSRNDYDEYGMTQMGVEAVAGFGAVFQQLRDTLVGEVKVIAMNPPRGGKLLRAQPWLNKIEAGRVYMVKGPWNKDFLAELSVFPAGDHDDQIDAVSIAWERLVGRRRNGNDRDLKTTPGILTGAQSRPKGGPRPSDDDD